MVPTVEELTVESHEARLSFEVFTAPVVPDADTFTALSHEASEEVWSVVAVFSVAVCPEIDDTTPPVTVVALALTAEVTAPVVVFTVPSDWFTPLVCRLG